MNLDDLMAVWRSQDAAPLHGVDKTLLHLALREDEAKLQQARRRERWFVYAGCAGLLAAMAVFLGTMIVTRDRKVMTGSGTSPLGLAARPPPCSRGARCPVATGRRRGASNALASRFEINSTGVSRSSMTGRQSPAPRW